MKRIQLIVKLFIIVAFFFNSCKSEAPAPPTPTPPPVEDKLAFTISPDPGSSIFAVLGASQDFTITVGSALPSAGITASIAVVKELDGSTVFSQNLNSTVPSFISSIQNLQNGVVCNVTITLTSKSSATNTISKSFKVARK
jgi:hypothetical protein